MKKRISIVYLVTALLFTFNTIAQQSINNNLDSDYISNKTVDLTKDANDYTGSPYFNEKFSKGNIYKSGELIAINKGLRYNASKDEFEIENSVDSSNKLVKVIKKSNNLSIKMGINEFTFIHPGEGNNVHGYFILLESGDKFSLLKKIKKKYIPGQKAYSSMSRDTAPMYKEKSIYFLLDANGQLTELPNSKKGKLEAFQSNKKELKSFLKENKLNINKENSIKKLVAYFNTL